MDEKENNKKWWYNINSDKHFLVLSDDIDSYLSCLFLRKKFGVDIGGFYDFKNLYKNSKVKTKGKEPIFVDIDVCNGFAFGNHVTAFKNRNCVNFNYYISQNDYTDKFAGSTLITLFYGYKYNLKEKDHDKVRFWVMIDSWQKQFFEYRKRWDSWVKDLKIEYLTDIVGAKDKDWYENKRELCGLNGKIIRQDNGTLDYTTINFNAIKEEFGITVPKLKLTFDKKIGTFEIHNIDISCGIPEETKQLCENGRIFSNAMTRKKELKYSVFAA